MFKKNLCIFIFALTSFMTVSSHAYVQGSNALSVGTASLVASPFTSIHGGPLPASIFLVAGSALVVTGVAVGGLDEVEVVLKNIVNGSTAVLETSSSVANSVGVAVGSALEVVAESTGYSLVTSGKILAFVPNALGESLLYQSKLSH